jgi:FG-GAP-like repeat/Bacterial Ig domain
VRYTPLRLALLSLCFALLLSTYAFAQNATFTTSTSPSGIYQARTVTGDLNNDGREDFVSTQQVSSPLPGFTVQLSNGDGTYAAPVSYQLPETQAMAYDIVLADVNSDGLLDIIVTAQNFGFYEYLNNGDGTFREQANFVVPMARVMTVGDFNHDGRPDLAFECSPDLSSTSICVWFGNGDNGFDVGPTTTIAGVFLGSDLLMGDFDGDGKGDLAVAGGTARSQTTTAFLFGDNTGHFQVSPLNTDLGQLAFRAADLNGDGKSDLIGSPMNFQDGSPTNTLIVYYGNSARTADHHNIPLGSCATGYKPAIADFDGDGIPDIALTEFASCTQVPYNLVFKHGNGDGTFSGESVIYSSSSVFSEAYALRANHDTKPDLAVIHFTAANPQTELVDFLNTTSGNFPTCAPPEAATGFDICSPGATAPSGTVHFGIGAAGQTNMRKVEVWIDGNKVAEQKAHAFSHYGFIDADVALADGTHTFEVYAAGWDNLLQHTSTTLTVGGSGGGGGGTGSCPQPTSPGVNICSPMNGSTVTSPFTIFASGKNTNATAGMDVWLDGQKVGWYGGTTTVNIQDTAGPGSHQLDIYAVGVDGELKLSSSIFTVGSSVGGGGGGGACTTPSSPGVNICAPANGSTVTSPVTITAAGTNNGSTEGMDVWIDGHKFGWFGGTNMVNTQATLGAGTHQLDIYAVGTNGDLQRSTVIFSVSGTTGGGSCGPPSSPSVVICSPMNGTTVSSPVQITAYGMNNGSTAGMDLWIDGQHTPGWFGGTTSVSVLVNVSTGSHQLDVYASGTNGDLQHASVVFNVP